MFRTDGIFKDVSKKDMEIFGKEIEKSIETGDENISFKVLVDTGLFDKETDNRYKHLNGYEKIKLITDEYYRECCNRYINN